MKGNNLYLLLNSLYKSNTWLQHSLVVGCEII